MSPRKYTLETIFQRLARKDDPWKGMMRHARTLASRRKTLDKRVEEEVG
jgi:DNA primase